MLVNGIEMGESSGLLQIETPHGAASDGPMHPIMFDNGIGFSQSLPVLGGVIDADHGVLQLPFSFETMRWRGLPTSTVWCHAQVVEAGLDSSRYDLRYWDEHGNVVLEIDGYTTRRAERAALLRNIATSTDKFRYKVEEAPVSADRTPIRGNWGYRGAAPSELLDKPSDGFTWLPAESLDEALERDLIGLVRFWDVSDDDVDRAQAAVAAGLAELQTILAHENTPSVIWVGFGGRLGCSALAVLREACAWSIPSCDFSG